MNGRKRALLTKSALEWHNKRCTAQSTLCVGNKKGKTELKAMCDFKTKQNFFFFFLVSRYSGHDTIHVSPAQVSRCIDASMHRYALRKYQLRMRLLHNTELYRVNITISDYPSAQAFRYQNPTIGVLCLRGITERASICM